MTAREKLAVKGEDAYPKQADKYDASDSESP